AVLFEAHVQGTQLPGDIGSAVDHDGAADLIASSSFAMPVEAADSRVVEAIARQVGVGAWLKLRQGARQCEVGVPLLLAGDRDAEMVAGGVDRQDRVRLRVDTA